ncbi:hypothetical protein, partial [Rhodovulum euryhalinum]|uniref:hypothetical protein n=1 Tax=Rhodovulum euryhalinum TaxID=35805 RepID=UPI001A9F281B
CPRHRRDRPRGLNRKGQGEVMPQATFMQQRRFNAWFANSIPETEERFQSSVSNFQRAALLIPEGKIEEEAALVFAVTSLEILRASMKELRVASWSLGENLGTLSEGGARFVSNGRILGALLKDFSDFLDRADASIDEVLKSAKR